MRIIFYKSTPKNEKQKDIRTMKSQYQNINNSDNNIDGTEIKTPNENKISKYHHKYKKQIIIITMTLIISIKSFQKVNIGKNRHTSAMKNSKPYTVTFPFIEYPTYDDGLPWRNAFNTGSNSTDRQ